MKDKFPPGKFLVTVTNVLFGFSEVKRTPYIGIIFENENYLHVERIYFSDKASSYAIKFLSCFELNCYGVEFKSRMFDVKEIIGQKIFLWFGWKESYNNGKLYKRISVIEFKKNEAKKELNSEFDINVNEAFNDKVCMTEIFGGDINDIAHSMGKDPSDITDVDIREYNGY